MVAAKVCPRCRAEYDDTLKHCTKDGSFLYQAAIVERIGQRFKDYVIKEILGEGGMGVVYKGLHVVLEKPVALKLLHAEFAAKKDAVEQFLREAKAASRILHPHIVDVTDFGITDTNDVFLVMEYLEGESLESRLARVKPLSVFDSVGIVYQIARGLGAAHEQNIVHRDLKPANVFLINREGRRMLVRSGASRGNRGLSVEPEGKFDFVKLLDFGVAKFTDLGPSPHTRAGLVFGTPHYLAPEQAKAKPVDGRADIYSLGVLFYEMVTGILPFNSESILEVLNAHVSGRVIPPKDRNPSANIDEGTNQTILRCLEKNPDDRFQTMDDLCNALQDCVSDQAYLRNAHKLPGAQEAGITIPPPSYSGLHTLPSDEFEELDNPTLVSELHRKDSGGLPLFYEDELTPDPKRDQILGAETLVPESNSYPVSIPTTAQPILDSHEITVDTIGKSSVWIWLLTGAVIAGLIIVFSIVLFSKDKEKIKAMPVVEKSRPVSPASTQPSTKIETKITETLPQPVAAPQKTEDTNSNLSLASPPSVVSTKTSKKVSKTGRISAKPLETKTTIADPAVPTKDNKDQPKTTPVPATPSDETKASKTIEKKLPQKAPNRRKLQNPELTIDPFSQ